MRSTSISALAICLSVLPLCAAAQDKPATPESTSYKLVYRLIQIGPEGKPLGSRSYSTMIFANDPHGNKSKIRSGDKIPIATGQLGQQYQYQDIGTDIDTTDPSVHNHQLHLYVTARSSEVAKAPSDPSLKVPVFRQMNWESNVVVTLDKPTIIFTSDNVSDTGKTELELTATPIKEP